MLILCKGRTRRRRSVAYRRKQKTRSSERALKSFFANAYAFAAGFFVFAAVFLRFK
jgi:hypothetical protein